MTLKEYLQDNKIKQHVFAEQLGIGAAHMSEVISGNATPSLRLALRIYEKTKGHVTPFDYHIDINRAA